MIISWPKWAVKNINILAEQVNCGDISIEQYIKLNDELKNKVEKVGKKL